MKLEHIDNKVVENKKKSWIKPEILSLDIKKITRGGSGTGAEGNYKWGPPYPS
jgi:hypothetical protein